VVGERSHLRSRNQLARRPSFESLEQRKLLATSTLVLAPSLGSTFTGSSVSPFGPPGMLFSGEAFNGGDYLGSLNGTTAVSTYSLDDEVGLDGNSVPTPGTYDATVTNDGTAFGTAVPNAGAIAWLLTNIGPTAHTEDAQAALQAAVWRLEYGLSKFQLDGADNGANDDIPNDPTLIADYEADFTALGSNTAPISSVLWISPTDPNQGGSPLQALVGFQDSSVAVESLTLPTTSVPEFSATYVLDGEITPSTLGGGNFLGTLNSTRLSATYCLNIDLGIGVPATFSAATVTHDATVWGQTVPRAGAISWLVTNIGPTATTPEQQDALQAAIWNVEYGTTLTQNGGFQLDGADNSNSPFIEGGYSAAKLVADYKADLAALGSKTALISNVLWITPNPDTGYPPSPGNGSAQGLVALAISPADMTKTTVTSSLTPAAFGRPLTFKATVVDTTSPGRTPTGSVQFQIDGSKYGNPVPLGATGTAAIADASLAAGAHLVDAVYIPNGNFVTTTSPNYKETITADTTRIVVTSSANPAKHTQALNFTVTVLNTSPSSTAVPLGTVVIQIDGKTKGSLALSKGKAALNGIKLPVGTHTVTVLYKPANGNFQAGTGQLIGGEKITS
ncbi:MAG TPA: Ig-like domain-containing protein, partial [Isosphaeraceae bacterium]|nr:Ig-like domain-containing protein [Isosphaeraceae bacterium]